MVLVLRISSEQEVQQSEMARSLRQNSPADDLNYSIACLCVGLRHPGSEISFVVSGKVEVRTASDQHELSEVDAIYFNA